MQTLRKINFVRALIFLILYIFLAIVIFTVFYNLETLIVPHLITPNISTTLLSIIVYLPFLTLFIATIVSYLILNALTLTKVKALKFSFLERLFGFIGFPLLISIILALWVFLTIWPKVQSLQSLQSVLALDLSILWLMLIILMPIIQLLVLVVGELIVFIVRKAHSKMKLRK